LFGWVDFEPEDGGEDEQDSHGVEWQVVVAEAVDEESKDERGSEGAGLG